MKFLILIIGTLLAQNYASQAIDFPKEAYTPDKAKRLEKQTTQEIVKYLDTKFEMEERGFQLDRISNMTIIEDGFRFDALFMNPTSHDTVTYTVEVVPKTGILAEDIRITQTINTVNYNLYRKYPVLSKLMGLKDGRTETKLLPVVEDIDLYRRAVRPKTVQATDLLVSFNTTDFFNYLNSSDYIKYQYFRNLTDYALNFSESLKNRLMNFTMKDYVDLINEKFGTKLTEGTNKTAIFDDLITDERWRAKKSFVDNSTSTADDLSQLTNQTRRINRRGKNYTFESYYNFFELMNRTNNTTTKRNNLRRLTATDTNIDQDMMILEQMTEQSLSISEMEIIITEILQKYSQSQQIDQTQKKRDYNEYQTKTNYSDKYRQKYDSTYKSDESQTNISDFYRQKYDPTYKSTDSKKSIVETKSLDYEEQNQANKRRKEEQDRLDNADEFEKQQQEYATKYDLYGDKYAEKYADKYQATFVNQSDPTRITNLDWKSSTDYQQYLDLQNKYRQYFDLMKPRSESNQTNSTRPTQQEIQLMTTVMQRMRDMVEDKFDKQSTYWKELNSTEFEQNNRNITILADQGVTYMYNTLGYHYQNVVNVKQQQAKRLMTDYNLVLRYKNQMEDVQHFMITMMIDSDQRMGQIVSVVRLQEQDFE